jgi:hypothetical protein
MPDGPIAVIWCGICNTGVVFRAVLGGRDGAAALGILHDTPFPDHSVPVCGGACGRSHLLLAHTSSMWGSRPLFGLGPYDYGVMPSRYLMEFPSDVINYASWVRAGSWARKTVLPECGAVADPITRE